MEEVVITCNLSEDYIGYATRYGDAAGDFAPLAQFTKGGVKRIGHYLGFKNCREDPVGWFMW